MTDSNQPHRLVDTHNQGWFLTNNGTYEADYGFKRALTSMTLADIEASRGPVRPVLPITDADKQFLIEQFRVCGRKTVATIAAALEEVFHRLRETRGGLTQAANSSDYALRTLRAGREGSSESEFLNELVWIGNGLNLAKPERGKDNSAEALRLRGPSRRVAFVGFSAISGVIHRWVTDPNRYTEVAETLASVVSQFTDTLGPTGWRLIADQWLQPTALAHDEFVACYRLLYSQSRHFNPHLLG